MDAVDSSGTLADEAACWYRDIVRLAVPAGPVFGPVHSIGGDLTPDALCCKALWSSAFVGVAGSVGMPLGAHLCASLGGR